MNEQRQETPPTRYARPAWMLCLALAAGGAWAQSVVLGHVEGSAAITTQGDEEWMELENRRNLRVGERLWTDTGTRAELQAGRHLLRLDSQSHLGVDAVQAGATQISLRKGSLHARVGPLGAMENFEVGTPNLAFRASAPGRYRVDVDGQRGVTQVSVQQGVAKVYGENAEVRELQAGQRMTFAGRALAPAAALRTPQADAFDGWVLARERPAEPPSVATVTPPNSAAVARTPPTVMQRPAQAMGAARKPGDGDDAQLAEDDDTDELTRQRQARREAQRRDQARREAWARQQKALSEQWRREHENWLRYNDGRPPAYPLYPTPSQGIPARRVG